MQFADRVQETTTTTGTGNLTLGGATDGYVTFASALDGAECNYLIAAEDGSWEVGVGTVTAPSTLSRDTVTASSTGAKLDLPAGTHIVSHVLGAAGVQGIKAYTDDHATETGGIHGAPVGERIAHTGDFGTNAAGDRTVSTEPPSGGSNGDLWYEVD